MLAAMGLLDIVGTTASGWLTDRMDPRRLLFWYYALRGVSPTVAITARKFGPEKSSVVFGWVFTFHQLGGAAAAYGAGLVRGWHGDYLPVFIAGGILCGVAALVVSRIPASPRRSVPLAATAPATP
jgi:predicted MFS family arabinose efflux permease